MKKINIKQIENIAKVFTALAWVSVSWFMLGIHDVYNYVYDDVYHDVLAVIWGIMLIGFGISLPLYVLVRFYNHIVDTLSKK